MGGFPAEDFVGRTYGLLTVLERAGRVGRNPGWRCRCTCGLEVIVRSDRLKAGQRKACARNGHYSFSNPLKQAYASEYSSWCRLRSRCAAKTGKSWRNYGAHGVTVCDRWESFAAFVEDMGVKPTPAHSIDRHPDHAGNYEPTNCRWATAKDQSRNLRNSVYVNYRRKRMLLVELAERVLIDPNVLRGRLKNGWNIERAVSKPVRKKRKNRIRSKIPTSAPK